MAEAVRRKPNLSLDVWRLIVECGSIPSYPKIASVCKMLSTSSVASGLFRAALEGTAAVYQLPFMRTPIDFKAFYRRFSCRGDYLPPRVAPTTGIEDYVWSLELLDQSVRGKPRVLATCLLEQRNPHLCSFLELFSSHVDMHHDPMLSCLDDWASIVPEDVHTRPAALDEFAVRLLCFSKQQSATACLVARATVDPAESHPYREGPVIGFYSSEQDVIESEMDAEFQADIQYDYKDHDFSVVFSGNFCRDYEKRPRGGDAWYAPAAQVLHYLEQYARFIY